MLIKEYVKFLDKLHVVTKENGEVIGEVTGFGKQYLALKLNEVTVVNIKYSDIVCCTNLTTNVYFNYSMLGVI